MISFMLGQVEHETRFFLPHKLVCGKLMCFAFGLSLDLVVGYADWSHTFWSCNLGRNGSDNFVMAYSSLLREKKNFATP